MSTTSNHHYTSYLKVSHAKRISCIYKSKIHNLRPPRIAALEGLASNSVRNYIEAYEKHGRTNRKLKHKISLRGKPALSLMRHENAG